LNVVLKKDTPVSGLMVVIMRIRLRRSGLVVLEDWPLASAMAAHTTTRRTDDISLLPSILLGLVSTKISHMFHLHSPLVFIRYAVYSQVSSCLV
jgi:hypothetical protein